MVFAFGNRKAHHPEILRYTVFATPMSVFDVSSMLYRDLAVVILILIRIQI